MGNTREDIETFLEQLAKQRDELRVKISLAKLEVRDEWEKIEKKWERLRANAPLVREEIDSTAAGVAASLRQAAEEIREGYARLRSRL